MAVDRRSGGDDYVEDDGVFADRLGRVCLSDAAESIVNLIGAIVALVMLTIAARPADDDHAFGHSKAEYFSSGIEGGLIVIAAISIAAAAIERLSNPQPIEQAGVGLLVAVVASAINFSVSRVLAKAGKQYNSITLEADAKHLMTDVWTSAGVIGAVAAVAITELVVARFGYRISGRRQYFVVGVWLAQAFGAGADGCGAAR